MNSVISVKPEECENAQGGQKLLADTADMANMADTQFVGITDSAHVCQKQLADTAELADMADMPNWLAVARWRASTTVLFACQQRLYIDRRGPAASPGLP